MKNRAPFWYAVGMLIKVCFALLLSLLLCPASLHAQGTPSGVFDVRAFGAKGDGVTPDTAAINQAIAAASAAGGGEVRLTAGTYLCGSVHLQNNVTLYLGQGATLLAAGPGDAASGAAYDAPEPDPAAGEYEDFGHRHWQNSLLWGIGLHDVTIEGPGRIWGRGLVRSDNEADGRGNKSIGLKFCRNVTLRDFTIQHGGWFGLLATGVDNLTIDNLKVDTNRDGMDIDGCRNVRIDDCTVNSPQDDGICLKSSYGLGLLRPTENVTITNCAVSGYDEGTVLDGTFQHTGREPVGRIKFGTESNGGFKNVVISNCTFAYCRGLALEEVDGGTLEDVSISNITMRHIVNAPLYVWLGARLRGPAGTSIGQLQHVTISHLVADQIDPRSSVIISGVIGHPVQDVTLSDIHLWYDGGGTKEQAAITPPEDAAAYPEPDTLGVMPAYGFFVRHVQGLTLRDVQTRTLTPDQRPPFVLTDVEGANIAGLDAQCAPGVPIFALTHVSHLQQSK